MWEITGGDRFPWLRHREAPPGPNHAPGHWGGHALLRRRLGRGIPQVRTIETMTVCLPIRLFFLKKAKITLDDETELVSGSGGKLLVNESEIYSSSTSARRVIRNILAKA